MIMRSDPLALLQETYQLQNSSLPLCKHYCMVFIGAVVFRWCGEKSERTSPIFSKPSTRFFCVCSSSLSAVCSVMASAYLSYVAPAPAPVKMIRRSSLVHASSSRLNNRTNMPRLMCSPGGAYLCNGFAVDGTYNTCVCPNDKSCISLLWYLCFFTCIRGMLGKIGRSMALLKNVAFFIFPPSAMNLWWSSAIDSVERASTGPRWLGATFSWSAEIKHHRQQWHP